MAIPGALLDTAVAAANAYGVNEDVFLNQVMQESGFDPSADSGQASGISQFTPETADSLGIDPSDPVQSLYGQASLMRSYLDKYGGSYPLALAAYNAGPGAVDRYGGVPPFAETQNYVQTILGNSGGGISPMSPAPAPTPPPSIYGGGGGTTTKAPAEPKINGLTAEQAATLAASHGYVPTNPTVLTGGGNQGFATQFQGPDGNPVTLESIAKGLTKAPSATGGTSGNPLTRSVGGVLYQYNPTTGNWEAAAGGGTSGGTGGSLAYNPAYQAAQIQKTNTDIAQAKVAQNWLVQKQLFEQRNNLTDQAIKTRQQVIDIGTKIGELAANPIDRGQEAATILGMGGAWGMANRQSEITNDSLVPLQNALSSQQSAMGDLGNIQRMADTAQTAFNNYNPQTGVFPQQAAAPVAAPGAPPAPSSAPLPSSQPVLPPSAMTPPTPGTPNTTPPGLDLNLGQPPLAPPPQGGITPDAFIRPLPPGTLPGLATGGDTEGAYISGEKGPEINIPSTTNPGETVVINAEQAKHFGINLDKLAKYEAGGIFSLASKTPQSNPVPVTAGSIYGAGGGNIDTSPARDFLTGALNRATAGTPFNASRLPAPVFASAPGFSPDVTKLLASLNAMAGLYSPEEYQRLAQVYAPQGITGTNIGRSA